jgi:hypothetical protein
MVSVPVKLEAPLEFTICRAKGTFPELCKFLARIHYVNGSLLEFHGVASGTDGNVDEPLCQVNVAVVVDSDFCDHIAGIRITYGSASNRNNHK